MKRLAVMLLVAAAASGLAAATQQAPQVPVFRARTDAQRGTELRIDLPLASHSSGQYLAKITMTAGKTVLDRNLVFSVR